MRVTAASKTSNRANLLDIPALYSPFTTLMAIQFLSGASSKIF